MGYNVDMDQVQTNMVTSAAGVQREWFPNYQTKGVDTLTIDDSSIRAVTHLHITDEDVDRAIRRSSLPIIRKRSIASPTRADVKPPSDPISYHANLADSCFSGQLQVVG